MFVLSTNQKGAIAEAAIAFEAMKLGINVLRPLSEALRYDLVLDLGGELLRVQCKWARRREDVIEVQVGGCYHSPGRGYVRSTYASHEVDAVAAYCQELDQCFLIPISRLHGQGHIYLRTAPARNNQRGAVNIASEYEFGAIAQLGERRRGTAEAVGSSPTSSTPSTGTELGAHQYRQKFGWYMERAAAGESFLITRRGKPYARLSPPHEQLDLPAPEPAEVVPIRPPKERTA